MSLVAELALPSVTAIIPAGGIGSRAQTSQSKQPKQYRLIQNKAMLLHSVEALLADERVTSVHIGVAASDDWIHQLTLPEHCYVHPTGGETRADTVLNTLKILDIEEHAWVLVHDAARPGLPLKALDQLITRCISQDMGGILALPVGDTVKREQAGQGMVERTIDRQGLWLAQTPQMFKKQTLEQALVKAIAAGFNVTDEASAIEFVGEPCLLVPGHWRNLKVTWPEDFELVEYFL